MYVQYHHLQAHTNPKQTNSNAPGTLGAMYLCQAQNIQGGHDVMDLASGQVITHGSVSEITILNMIIKAVEKWDTTRLQIRSQI